jgi:tetratricopeptide (TPR) repeat protein
VGNTVQVAIAAANIGEVLVDQGRYDEVEEPLQEARRAYLAAGFSDGIGFVDLLIGRMYGIDGRLTESVEALERSIKEREGLGVGGAILEAEIYLADARCRAGSPEAGLKILTDAEASAPPDYVDYYKPLLFRIRGSILASAGRTDESVESLEAGIALSDERADAFAHALLVLTLAGVDPSLVSESASDEAQGTLQLLGVRSAPGISLSV